MVENHEKYYILEKDIFNVDKKEEIVSQIISILHDNCLSLSESIGIFNEVVQKIVDVNKICL